MQDNLGGTGSTFDYKRGEGQGMEGLWKWDLLFFRLARNLGLMPLLITIVGNNKTMAVECD